MRNYWTRLLAARCPVSPPFQGSTPAELWILGPSPRMTLISSVGASLA
jgi:hypothetical protein